MQAVRGALLMTSKVPGLSPGGVGIFSSLSRLPQLTSLTYPLNNNTVRVQKQASVASSASV